MKNPWLVSIIPMLLVLLFITPTAKGKDYYQQVQKSPAELYALEKFYLNDSQLWSKSKQYTIALHACSYVLKTYPNHPRALNLLIVFAKNGIPLTTIQPYFDKALQAAPEQSMTYFLAGKLHQETGNAAAAIPFYHQAITKDPERGFYYYALAESYLATQQIGPAQTALKQALNLNFDITKLQATLQPNPAN